jgi:hypothetical protein
MRSKLALGSLLVATNASLTVAVTGLAGLTGDPSGPVGFLTPGAAAAELVRFEDCDELLQWYVDEALPEVGPYGLGGWTMALPAASVAGEGVSMQRAQAPDVASDSADPVESSGTGTNVQEVGIDEPDRAKTDGQLVVHVRRNALVVTDVTGPEAREVGSVPLFRNLPRIAGSSGRARSRTGCPPSGSGTARQRPSSTAPTSATPPRAPDTARSRSSPSTPPSPPASSPWA